MDNHRIRLCIADDDAIICDGLSKLLETEPDLQIVATAKTGLELLEILAIHKIDVALIDVDMPVLDGIEAVRKISGKYPHTKILMLTAFTEEESLGAALQAGATGFLTKDTPPSELAEQIRRAHRGELVLSAKPTKILAASYIEIQNRREQHLAFIQAVDSLPEHLRPVFQLLLKAQANKNIARALRLKESTVRSYVSDILLHTNCATRGELAMIAAKVGINR